MAWGCNDEKAKALVASLKTCAKQKDLSRGIRIHADILRRGLLNVDLCIGNSLVSMYARCGAFVKAREVLHELPVRDVVSWNALIAAYTQYGNGEEALQCANQMRKENLSPDAVTFGCMLKACSIIRATDKGKEIHGEIVREGLLQKSSVVGNALVDMYATCGELSRAQEVFNGLAVRDVFSWTTLISGYIHYGYAIEALNCFEQMQNEGVSPDSVTFTCILKACGSVRAVTKGEELHDTMARDGLMGKDVIAGNALVDMYAACGALGKARKVLDELPVQDIISWTTLITGYTHHGYDKEALDCLERMQKLGLSPNAITFASVLKACANLEAVEKGEQIHAEILRQGLLGGKDVTLGNALVDMYAKCGALVRARLVFDELCLRDIVSWNALIAGYTQHGHDEAAIKCFEDMQRTGFSPSIVTFACVLKACASLGDLEKGTEIHALMDKEEWLGKDAVLGNALVDMYAKCGSFSNAQYVFDKLLIQDIVSWTALIAGYSLHGQHKNAVDCFETMQSKGLSPDAAAYTCMVDLLGRAGHFERIGEMVKKMPFSCSFTVWFALMSACQTWENTELGRFAFEHAIQMYDRAAEAYLCMSNLYTAAGMGDEADKMLALRVKAEAWKKPGWCWLTDMNGHIHSFCVDDNSHLQSEDISMKLEEMGRKLLQEGYCPNLSLVLKAVHSGVG